jgi:Ni,Fe-hydrogenase maturation factor
MKKIIYVFGNPVLREDSLALKVAKKLARKFAEIEFKEFDTVDDLEGDVLYIMDVAKGIKKVELINNLELIKTSKICSIHDYDLSYELKLLKKLGKIKEVNIFCIPWGMKESEAVKEVAVLIKCVVH